MKAEEAKKNGRGGRRAGAGRPKGDRRLFSFRIEGRLADFIDSHKNRTAFIHNCIEEAFNRKEEDASFFALQTLGDIYSATSVRSMTLPKFDNARVVAGFPLALDTDEQAQSVDILRMLCPNPEASYLIKVRGDSMIDAGISDGDIIIVDKSNRTPSEHEAAVCEYNGEYTIKHIVQQAGKTWLVPANPKYPRIEIFEEDDFSVWGVVTYTIHKPRS
ncbi:SOS mutagenesis and repair protein UmuD [Alloprevotella tannerae]|uniref:LexA family protein n=1 Tax=Alloprevotella tannerae TaxID=76122 RepID=UPI001EDB7FD0|nr:S24 family peptidase [Alloprevotella tannerae]MCG2647710.1 SOS mutagenesis and repair protein UmuD [Alloprevotella tannerae]